MVPVFELWLAGADRSQDRQSFEGMLAAEAAKANHCQG